MTSRSRVRLVTGRSASAGRSLGEEFDVLACDHLPRRARHRRSGTAAIEAGPVPARAEGSGGGARRRSRRLTAAWILGSVALVAAALPVAGARAAVKCEGALAGPPLPGTLSPVLKLLQDVSSAHRSGNGTIPLSEFLVGVGGERDAALRELAQHPPLALERLSETSGKFSSAGANALSFRARFASSPTYVTVPKTIYGKYELIDDGIEFIHSGPPIRLSRSLDPQRREYQKYKKIIVRSSAIFLYGRSTAQNNHWDACYTLSN